MNSEVPSNPKSQHRQVLRDDQLLLEVIGIMLLEDTYELPVYQHNRLLGAVSFAKIIDFLTRDQGTKIHKLQYTVEAFLFVTGSKTPLS